MKEKWSLKGKRINEPDCARCSTENIYGEKDIVILRQKLIEDLSNMCLFHQELRGWNYPDRIIKVINKRFGVIDDD